jgi:hypothetical protein
MTPRFNVESFVASMEKLSQKRDMINFVWAVIFILIGAGIASLTFISGENSIVRAQSQTHAEFVISGDTTKRIYVLEDSITGMTWIGVPGKNVIKK